MREPPMRPGTVDAAQETPEPFEHARLVEFRRTAAPARIDGEAEAGVVEQRASVALQRRDDGNLECVQFLGERMLLQNLGVAPASGAIELGHHGRLIFDPDLIDAVLVAVEGEHAAVAGEADRLECVQHALRCEAGIRRALGGYGIIRHWGMIAARSFRSVLGVCA